MIAVSEEVREAIRRGAAVALETSVVAQGLPPPHNLEAARRCARAVRESGAVPAAVAVIGGRIVVGATDAELERLADPRLAAAKAGVRDLAAISASGRDAGTTVSATCAVAAQAGIRVFATGGIGGVHRRASPAEPLDVSSDLIELSRRQVCVVCAGPKAILDLPATSEALEALGVPVLGFGTSELPAFFTGSTGILLERGVPAEARRQGPDSLPAVPPRRREQRPHAPVEPRPAGEKCPDRRPDRGRSRSQADALLSRSRMASQSGVLGTLSMQIELQPRSSSSRSAA